MLSVRKQFTFYQI